MYIKAVQVSWGHLKHRRNISHDLELSLESHGQVSLTGLISFTLS